MTTYTSFDLVKFSRSTGTSIKRPWRDSNPRTRLRRPMLYPLSYRGLLCLTCDSPALLNIDEDALAGAFLR